MKAGDLRARVTILQQITTQDRDTGFASQSWSPLLIDEPAAMGIPAGRELIAAQAEGAKLSCVATLRYREGLVATMRLVHGGITYHIRSVEPDLKQRGFLRLTLESVATTPIYTAGQLAMDDAGNPLVIDDAGTILAVTTE